MRLTRLAQFSGAVLVALASNPADVLAQTSYGYQQNVRSGAKARVGDYNTIGSIRGQCVSVPALVYVTQQTQHGTLTVGRGRGRSNTASSPLAHCDGRMLPATVIFYQSRRGYRGLDDGSYVVRFPNGQQESYRKIFIVR